MMKVNSWRLIVLMALLSSCRSAYEGPLSDHFDGSEFYNPWKRMDSSFGKFLKWQFTSDAEEWPASVENHSSPDLPIQINENEVYVTFVNHATFLIQIGGLNILTDPVWAERASPVQWLGPKRVRAPGLAFEKLPPIHVVLVSHNHYDHMDLETLKKLSREHKPQIFVPLHDKPWLEDAGVTGVDEMDWWQTRDLGPEMKIHFAPAQHWSARTPFDRNRSLWGSFILEYRGRSIYFAGDTGYGPHFRWAAERVPPIEIAFMPIGAYEPRWFMEYAHNNPSDSIKAHRDLNAKLSIGMHFGCWQLTDEAIGRPVEDLRKGMHESGLSESEFMVPEVGRTYRFEI